MSGFLEKYNTDEVFLRGLIVSFLRSLNEKVKYIQVNDQQDMLEIFIPFFYSMSGDESFLQDFFLSYRNCATDQVLAEGNYDVIPRGIVIMQSPQIDTQGLTNKYTRMSYTKETVQGEMKTLSSFTNSVPLTVPFEVTIKVDTLLDAFKVFQSVVQTFYKSYAFSFEYEGFRIPCQVGFPENYDQSKMTEFSYNNNPQFIDFKFSVNIETYFPEKDLTTEKFRGNLMQAGIKMENIVNRRGIGPRDTEIL
jgi:hypothetical protein